jgi:thiamine biosynthesis lipoprotein
MTMNVRVACIVLLPIFLFSFPGCTPGPWFFETQGETQGTTYTVKTVFEQPVSRDEQAALSRQIETEIAREFERINQTMSTYIPDSELSKLNTAKDGEAIVVSPELFEVLQMARQVSEESNGAFDVTVGPLVDAWGFGPTQPDQLPPSQETLTTLQKAIGYKKLHLDADTRSVTKMRADIRIDLSAIAQGYSVDRVALALEGLGCANYMVEVGGEVRTAGVNREGVPWRIGIERPTPEGRSIMRIVPLSTRAMATSGDYRHFREVDGVRYSHTMDPRTMRPIAHNLASVTVLHEKCAMADAYATALNVLGPEEGMAAAERLGLPVLFIIHTGNGDFEERATTQFPITADAQTE